MAMKAVQKVIVAFPAKVRVPPGKPADHAAIDAILIHGLHNFFRAGKTSLLAPVNDPEPLVPPAKRKTMFPNVFGEKMGMSIDNHGRQIDTSPAVRAGPPWAKGSFFAPTSKEEERKPPRDVKEGQKPETD